MNNTELLHWCLWWWLTLQQH